MLKIFYLIDKIVKKIVFWYFSKFIKLNLSIKIVSIEWTLKKRLASQNAAT